MNHQDEHPKRTVNAGMFLQDACTSLAENLQMQSINSYQHLSSQLIDEIVEIEMNRLKANCNREEQHYVEQMLLQNPIIVERRSQTQKAAAKTNDDYYFTNETQNTGAKDEAGQVEVDSVGTNVKETVVQQQRAESCRRSRVNNKIKKAKTKYRHDFMSNRLMQSANMLECIQKMITQTETQLINQGFSGNQLQILRNIFYDN